MRLPVWNLSDENNTKIACFQKIRKSCREPLKTSSDKRTHTKRKKGIAYIGSRDNQDSRYKQSCTAGKKPFAHWADASPTCDRVGIVWHPGAKHISGWKVFLPGGKFTSYQGTGAQPSCSAKGRCEGRHGSCLMWVIQPSSQNHHVSPTMWGETVRSRRRYKVV